MEALQVFGWIILFVNTPVHVALSIVFFRRRHLFPIFGVMFFASIEY